MSPQYLSIKELATYMSISRSYIEHNWPAWAADHKVRIYRIGKKILLNKSDIDRMMEEKLVTA